MATHPQADSMGKTTIQVSEALADELYARKGRGESYEDVIWSLLDDDHGEPAPESVPAEPAADESSDIVVPASVPGRISAADARAAIDAAVELVASNGGVQRAEIIETVGAEHPLGYQEIGERGAWWRKIIRPGLEAHCRYQNGVGWVMDE